MKHLLKHYGFAWVTLIFFTVSFIGHWTFGWFAFVNEQTAHHQPVVTSDYFVEILRDTFENWQSEFLQLIWQVAGLAFLLYLGSPQSKDGSERIEAKLDLLLKKISPDDAEILIREIDAAGKENRLPD